MKRSSKKFIGKSGIGLPSINDVTSHEIGFMPSTLAMQMPSSYTTIFAECYDALLWMNGNVKQLERMLDRLI